MKCLVCNNIISNKKIYCDKCHEIITDKLKKDYEAMNKEVIDLGL
jgi:CDGSH-type Zn-finger protein